MSETTTVALSASRVVFSAVLALALALSFFSATGITAGEDFGAVDKVNRLIVILETPELAPGESGGFAFRLAAVYNAPIFNVSLRVDIFRYVTQGESVPINEEWTYRYPQLSGGNRVQKWTWDRIDPGAAYPLMSTVRTAADQSEMPSGSILSEAAYLLRFRMEFNTSANGEVRRFVLASPGHFEEPQWDAATDPANTSPCHPPWCQAGINLSMLDVDGILPDSSFIVKHPVPQWPLFVLVGAFSTLVALAALLWARERRKG